MKLEVIERKFESMGARVLFEDRALLNRYLFPWERDRNLIVDVLRDRKGEYFHVNWLGRVDLIVPDVRPADRHLLLMARLFEAGEPKDRLVKVLCGHDEREWFAAQVPGIEARDVNTAKEALKPIEAVRSQKRAGVKTKDRHRRKNKGFIRQGEWFFIPVDNVHPDPRFVTNREPIVLGGARAGNKPHVAEEAYQEGGEVVYVHPRWAPRGMTEKVRARLFKRRPQAARSNDWRIMRSNPGLYVRGKVRHPDHKTIRLHGWHRVALNREERGQAVAFLD